MTWYEHARHVWITSGGYGRVSLKNDETRRTRWESNIWVCNMWARVGLHESARTAKSCIERCLRVRDMEMDR